MGKSDVALEGKKEIVIRAIGLGIGLMALGILGIVFADPIAGVMNKFVGIVVAVILFVSAIINIIIFVKDRSNVPQLIIGIFAIAAGVVLLLNPKIIVILISVFLGIFLLLDGGFKIREGIAANKAKAKYWFVSLIVGIISVLLGILAVVYPVAFGTELTKFFVISACILLIVTGVTNFVHGILMSKV